MYYESGQAHCYNNEGEASPDDLGKEFVDKCVKPSAFFNCSIVALDFVIGIFF